MVASNTGPLVIAAIFGGLLVSSLGCDKRDADVPPTSVDDGPPTSVDDTPPPGIPKNFAACELVSDRTSALRCVFNVSSEDEPAYSSCIKQGGRDAQMSHSSSRWCTLDYYASDIELPTNYRDCTLRGFDQSPRTSLSPSTALCFLRVEKKGSFRPDVTEKLLRRCASLPGARVDKSEHTCGVLFEPEVAKSTIPSSLEDCLLAGGGETNDGTHGPVCQVSFAQPHPGRGDAQSRARQKRIFELCWNGPGWPLKFQFGSGPDATTKTECQLFFSKVTGLPIVFSGDKGPTPTAPKEDVSFDVNFKDGQTYEIDTFLMLEGYASGVGTMPREDLTARFDPSGHIYHGGSAIIDEPPGPTTITLTAQTKSGFVATETLSILLTYRKALIEGKLDHHPPPAGTTSTLTATDVANVIKKHAPSLAKNCLLPTSGPQTELKMGVFVWPDGVVKTVFLHRRLPRSSCVLTEVKKWKFPPFAGERPLNVPLLIPLPAAPDQP